MPLSPNDLTDTQLSGDIIVYPGQNSAALQPTANVENIIGAAASVIASNTVAATNAATPRLNVVTAAPSTTAIGSASVVVIGSAMNLTPGGWHITGGMQIDNSQSTARAFSGWLAMASGSVTSTVGAMSEEVDNITPVTNVGIDLNGYVTVATAGTMVAYVGANASGASVVTSASVFAPGSVPSSGFVAVQVH